MMKLKNILAALAAISAGASALAAPTPLTEQQINAVVGHCRCVMESGVCSMETRPARITQPMALASYGAVRLQPADVNYLVDAGPAMCDAAEAELRKDSTSPRSAYARSKWRQTWVGPCVSPVPVK